MFSELLLHTLSRDEAGNPLDRGGGGSSGYNTDRGYYDWRVSRFLHIKDHFWRVREKIRIGAL